MTYEEMEQIAALDLDVPEQRERALAWRIEDRPTLEWAMGILARGEREAEEIQKASEAARKRIDDREFALLRRNVRATEWIRAAVTEYARTHRKDLLVRGKTVHLVHGEIAFTDRTKETVEIEDEAAAPPRYRPDAGSGETLSSVAFRNSTTALAVSNLSNCATPPA